MLPKLSKHAPTRGLETLPEESPVCDFYNFNNYDCDRERYLIDQDKRRRRRRRMSASNSSASDAGSDDRDAEIRRLQDVIRRNREFSNILVWSTAFFAALFAMVTMALYMALIAYWHKLDGELLRGFGWAGPKGGVKRSRGEESREIRRFEFEGAAAGAPAGRLLLPGRLQPPCPSRPDLPKLPFRLPPPSRPRRQHGLPRPPAGFPPAPAWMRHSWRCEGPVVACAAYGQPVTP